jgi:hypothetical protein
VLTNGSVEDHSRRRELRVRIAAALEPLPDDERNTEIEALDLAAGSSTQNCLPLLTWNEMRAMRNEGFEFGAHTVNHIHLSRVPVQQVRAELSNCVGTLVDELGERPRAFAYPYGDLDDKAVHEVRGAAFEAAYAAHPGVVVPGETCRFRIPRLQIALSAPDQVTALIVALKLSKYLPRIVQPALSRLFDAPIELPRGA